jgi:Fic-DOC domain mobile mystery protein B
MKMEFDNIPGATPLDPDEITGLIPKHITTHNQLNEWEAENILGAEIWLFSTTTHGNFLTIDFIMYLHKKMFGNTWAWAGKFRTTERNIGVSPYKITTDLKILLEDIRYQILNKIIPIDEIAYRFHHRLVTIHPFPNGNGRHARLMTDLLLVQSGNPRFTWGKIKLDAAGPVRKKYIDALRKADKHDYSELASFVRS